MASAISVIVPTYNEAQYIEHFLDKLLQHDFDEVIVVDGGSKDNTRQLAQKYINRVYLSPVKGRAAQMNLGASLANSDILLFLHADTFLPPTAKDEILYGVSKKKCGRFRDSFLPRSLCLDFYAFFTRWQYFSYGDQAFFLHRSYFDLLNGYSTTHPFEDIDFYKRLRKLQRPYISKLSVKTSSRRFVHAGVIKQAAIDFLFIVMIECCLPHHYIHQVKKKLYQDIR